MALLVYGFWGWSGCADKVRLRESYSSYRKTTRAHEGAENLDFSDDLDAALSGLVATALPAVPPCGPGSVIAGTSFLTLTGGSVLAGGML